VTFAITGANGFLGVHIIHHLLKQGHTVRAIIRSGASLAEFHKVKEFYNLKPDSYSQLIWYECDLYDTEELNGVFRGADYIMHLAGVISYLGKDFNRLLEVNQQYTANVVNVAKDAGVKKLLYCSSIAAIAKSGKEDRITESAEWDDELPHSNYGYSKHLGELELWRGAEEGLATVAINPGIILGYGDWTKGSNKLFGNAQKGFPFYSNGITGWVGVEDVARVAIRLCTSDIVGERYIVVAENKSFKEVADMMTTALGTKKPSIEIKGLLYKIAYYLIAFKEFVGLGGMLSRETVKASIAVNHFDNTKVKKALDFDFEDMDEVIRKAV
jgi:nucleoside-diphosphate-sugar epimerase